MFSLRQSWTYAVYTSVLSWFPHSFLHFSTPSSWHFFMANIITAAIKLSISSFMVNIRWQLGDNSTDIENKLLPHRSRKTSNYVQQLLQKRRMNNTRSENTDCVVDHDARIDNKDQRCLCLTFCPFIFIKKTISVRLMQISSKLPFYFHLAVQS